MTTSLISGWRCTCGATFENAHAAFLHRDGTDYHLVNPYVAKLTGIEKEMLQNEIQLCTRSQ